MAQWFQQSVLSCSDAAAGSATASPQLKNGGRGPQLQRHPAPTIAALLPALLPSAVAGPGAGRGEEVSSCVGGVLDGVNPAAAKRRPWRWPPLRAWKEAAAAA